MTKEGDFMASFNLMRASFRHPIVQEETIAYLEYLSELPYISEVMNQASKGELGIDSKFMPNVPQLIAAHKKYEKEVEEKAKQENADKFSLEAPVAKQIDTKKRKKVHLLFDRAGRHGYSGMEQTKYIFKRMGWDTVKENE